MNPKSPIQDDRHGAIISADGLYRYFLHRTWNTNRGVLAFIMLNPSIADETQNDPTVRRCVGYAKNWGYGKLIVGNLFALRSTNPEKLLNHPEPVGSKNDEYLQAICEEADRVVVAWGTKGSIRERDQQVVRLLENDVYALKVTKNGYPVHPLYQPADICPVIYE